MAKENKKNSIRNKKIKAFVASFFTIIGFIIAIILWKDDEYAMYYAKHGLILFIGQLIIHLADPWLIPGWFAFLLWAFWIILWAAVWINALSGFRRRTFIISDLADKLKL